VSQTLAPVRWQACVHGEAEERLCVDCFGAACASSKQDGYTEARAVSRTILTIYEEALSGATQRIKAALWKGPSDGK
jgi:hypothetical protein